MAKSRAHALAANRKGGEVAALSPLPASFAWLAAGGGHKADRTRFRAAARRGGALRVGPSPGKGPVSHVSLCLGVRFCTAQSSRVFARRAAPPSTGTSADHPRSKANRGALTGDRLRWVVRHVQIPASAHAAAVRSSYRAPEGGVERDRLARSGVAHSRDAHEGAPSAHRAFIVPSREAVPAVASSQRQRKICLP